MKRFLAALVLISSLVGTSLVLPQKTNALSGSEFQAGRTIDDGQFFNGNGLDANQIQAFLNSKVPSCDTNHARSSSSNDSGPPYTCLKDFRQDTWNIPADAYCRGFSSGNKSAAQIIYEVGVSCGINPKVILVTLQKEQSLITDTWPWQIQYDHATGYACPDTAPCDPNYAGFFRQVYYGARQFNRYAQDTHIFTSYRPYRSNYIQYNPNASCGGTNIYIENQATSGLYIYTPYQPNAAALNNLYGTGDSCSAYGNRNFWRLYTDWFGTTYAGAYVARVVEHSTYPNIKPGESAPMYARFKNIGNSAWYDDIGASAAPGRHPVRLATDLPLNRASTLGTKWAYPNRPGINFAKVYRSDGTLSSDQHVAHPGETVEFWFAYHAPHTHPGGSFIEGFRPVVEGLGPMNDTGSYVVVNVAPAIYKAQFHSQSPFPHLTQSQRAFPYISYKNTGNMTWYDETSVSGTDRLPVHLATDYPLNRNSPLSSRWPWSSRASVNFSAVYEANGTTLAANQHEVRPGQIGKFMFETQASFTQNPGFYGEPLRPIVQGLGPMNDTGTWMGIYVYKAEYRASFAGQSAFQTIQKGQFANAYIQYKNTGNVEWYDDISASAARSLPVKLGTDYPLNRASVFGSTWLAPHRVSGVFSAVYESDGTTLAANQHVVQPGQIARYAFRLSVPLSQPAGFYGEPFRPVIEGLGPMNDTGTWMGLTVQ